ncbi:hypothetical protein J3S97_05160 [Lactococcus cremoris]|uniref:hypothetical protein n=1 Tax=Lactococcus lactis subsp. cremoris TaxID=1359 RepID=UPI00038BA2C0|nr:MULTISPECIES: hypothetical protein [Lactococcus]EQC56633.1 hypothetical protein LLT5_05470 [Lactococcus cremoris subsp. cremoris TIFN5]EQC84485.1 hypothetical protein LLT1_05640 [Lactococcus cremoris subsp. cremoris TIFN1]AXN65027.1 hypothetical protein L3107_0789 [Lactococcus cremoris]MDM5143916.1 hypothetical protein [Lactococcus lactis]MRM52085.1 hypothetical protein [Lactococcus cremoris]
MNTPNLPLKVTVDVNKLIDQIQPIFKNDLTKMISDYFSTKRMENLVKILSKAVKGHAKM